MSRGRSEVIGEAGQNKKLSEANPQKLAPAHLAVALDERMGSGVSPDNKPSEASHYLARAIIGKLCDVYPTDQPTLPINQVPQRGGGGNQ